MSATWMFVALVETCVGSAMALYGWKQRESVSLVFGIALTVLPGIVREGWIAALVGVGFVVLFFVVKRTYD